MREKNEMSWKEAKDEARKMRESTQMFQDVEDDDAKHGMGGRLSAHNQSNVSLGRVSGCLVGVVKDFLMLFNHRHHVKYVWFTVMAMLGLFQILYQSRIKTLTLH